MTAHNDILVWSIHAALITPAQAEPVHLACYGKIRVTEFRGSHAEELPTQEGQSMSVIVDRSAGLQDGAIGRAGVDRMRASGKLFAEML